MGLRKVSHSRKMEELTSEAVKALNQRGIELKDIAEIVYSLQKDYIDDLTVDACLHHLDKVLQKREVVHAVLTGIALDEAAEKDLLPEPISSIIKADEGLYGIDEILPLSIVNVYGSIGYTNFGYLDKKKYGIIKNLDEAKENRVNTFLDDIVAALAAAVASRLAHSIKD